MAATKAKEERPVPVMFHVLDSDRIALQREALRRRVAGRARSINMSAVLRELIAEWREGLAER